jgi:hypothetical protein
MLPNPEYAPAARPKRPANQLVAPLICFEFLLPELAIINGEIRVFRALMPETSIHKDRQFEFGKDKIRFPRNWPVATPPGDALSAEELHQSNFRLLVSASTDARHHLRAFGFGEDIGHYIA